MIVAEGKHENRYFTATDPSGVERAALVVVAERYHLGYYDRIYKEVREILRTKCGRGALQLLTSRRDHEYEGWRVETAETA